MADEKLSNVLRSKIPALVGGTIATVLVTVFSSYLGSKATLIGLALTTLVSGMLSTVSEHTIHRTTERARLRWHGYHIIDPYKGLYRTQRNVPYKLVAASMGLIGLASFATITAVEAAAGKPISNVVRGTKGSGFTVSHSAHTPSPTDSAAPRRPRPSVSFTTPAPSSSPTPTFSPVPATLTPSTAPALTPSPSSTPSLTPTATPSTFQTGVSGGQ